MKEIEETGGNMLMLDTDKIVAIIDAHPIVSHVEVVFDAGGRIVLNIPYDDAFDKIFGTP